MRNNPDAYGGVVGVGVVNADHARKQGLGSAEVGDYLPDTVAGLGIAGRIGALNLDASGTCAGVEGSDEGGRSDLACFLDEMTHGCVRCAKILDQGIRDKHHEDREATTIQQ